MLVVMGTGGGKSMLFMLLASSVAGGTASIIFVTLESAMTKAFAELMNRLQEMNQLDRIVVDECHTVLDSSPGFRPKLRQLGQLASSAQMVYLTATLPPREEGEFYGLMGIVGDVVVKFRGCTSRSNVRYEVRTVHGVEQ